MESNNYYVYAHYRLDNFTPFYIGKGKGNRVINPERNKHHDRVQEKYGSVAIILFDNLTEQESLEYEKNIIDYLVFIEGYGIDINGFRQYEDNYLTNQTWGGEGTNGYWLGKTHSEETKVKMSQSGGHPQSESTKQKLRDINLGKSCSQETEQKISEATKCENNPSAKKVICITTGEIFEYAKLGAEKYKRDLSGLIKCCRGKTKYCGKLEDGTKLVWKYYEDYIKEVSKC